MCVVRNVCVVAVVIEFSTRPRRLQRRKLDVLIFDSHFKSMLAVDLGDVVGELDRRGNFVRRQEGVAAQCLQTVDSESRKSAIESLLRDAQNAIRTWIFVKLLASGEKRDV